MITPGQVASRSAAAATRIAPFVEHTPVLADGELLYKCENLQTTGSFKLRGATTKLTSLAESELTAGVVTASTGNHGAAVAHAARALGAPATVYVPDMASPMKVDKIQRLGAEVRVHGSDGVESEREARRVAAESDLTYVSPYNDVEVIAGQGTIAVELMDQTPTIDTVVVAVGGGGLISGIASVLKDANPKTRVVGCSPMNSAAMAASLEAGELVEVEHSDTLSDGTHGGVEEGSITFGLCQQLIDDFVLVEEDEIRSTMSGFIAEHDMVIEGSAAVAIAAARKSGRGRTAVILCGANVSADRLADL